MNKPDAAAASLGPKESVAVVIVTYNRRDLLEGVLEAVKNQTRPVQSIIIVDNGNDDLVEPLVSRYSPLSVYLQMGANLGAAGGFSAGMEAAHQRGHDWIWILADDTPADLRALEDSMAAIQDLDAERVGLVRPRASGCSGIGYWRGGLKHINFDSLTRTTEVDVTTFAGALIHRDVMSAVGYPRTDYFMEWEEYEYCLRMKDAGFRVFAIPVEGTTANAPYQGGSSPPWRGYYQTRNHLEMVLRRKHPTELLFWGVRQTGFFIATLLFLDSKWKRLTLRALGAWDGFRGKTGKTIDPAHY